MQTIFSTYAQKRMGFKYQNTPIFVKKAFDNTPTFNPKV